MTLNRCQNRVQRGSQIEGKNLTALQRRQIWSHLYKMFKKNNLSRFDETGRTKDVGESSGGSELKVSSPADAHSKSFLQARDDYVKEMSKEMMMSMKET